MAVRAAGQPGAYVAAWQRMRPLARETVWSLHGAVWRSCSWRSCVRHVDARSVPVLLARFLHAGLLCITKSFASQSPWVQGSRLHARLGVRPDSVAAIAVGPTEVQSWGPARVSYIGPWACCLHRKVLWIAKNFATQSVPGLLCKVRARLEDTVLYDTCLYHTRLYHTCLYHTRLYHTDLHDTCLSNPSIPTVLGPSFVSGNPHGISPRIRE